jgi:predicted kinase
MLSSIFQRLIELRGIQASGKTTLAKSMVEEDPHVVRVSKDDIRSMLRGSSYNKSDERLVKQCEMACAVAALDNGYSVVVDDTNLTPSAWRFIAANKGAKHVIHCMNVPVEIAIERDAQRTNPVGAAAIRATASRATETKP